MKAAERRTDKLALAILDAALIIGAGLLSSLETGPRILGLPVPAFIGYLLASRSAASCCSGCAAANADLIHMEGALPPCIPFPRTRSPSRSSSPSMLCIYVLYA